MSFHPEVMSEFQADLLRELAPLVDARGFHLAGGTAVALHLGHRVSVDLDWFTPDPFADPLVLLRVLRDADLAPSGVATDEGTLHVEVGGVRVAFLEYRYPLLAPLVDWSEMGCRLASLEDLACAKLSAVAGRGARRDFVDVHAIARSGISLERMVELYLRKFGMADPGHLLRSLVYFEDAEAEAMPRMLVPVEWTEIRRAFEAWVTDYPERTAEA